MRTLDRGEAAQRLRALSRAVILFHARPDGDAVGSAFALRRMMTLRGSDVWCVCTHEIPRRLRFLVELGGEQDSVLPEAVPARFADAPVVTVDTAAPAQAGEGGAPFLSRCVLMLDHHGRGTPYADSLIEPEAAATGELLCGLAPLLLDAPDAVVSARLFAAISSDTGCFKFGNASPATFRAAAALLEQDFSGCGLDAAEINRRLFDVRSAGALTAEQLALANLRAFAGGKVVLSTLSLDERREMGLHPEDTETMIDAIRVREGCAVAAMLKQQESDPGCWRVSLRSTGLDVAAVCARFGGGGHVRAAGCSLAADSADAAVQQLTQAILDAMEETTHAVCQ